MARHHAVCAGCRWVEHMGGEDQRTKREEHTQHTQHTAHTTHNTHNTQHPQSQASAYLVRSDGGMLPGLARAHVLRRYLFPNLFHQRIWRAFKLVGVAVYVAVREARDIDASGRGGRPDERQTVRVVEVGEDEIAGSWSCGRGSEARMTAKIKKSKSRECGVTCSTVAAQNVANCRFFARQKSVDTGYCGLKAREENGTGENGEWAMCAYPTNVKACLYYYY